MRHPCINSSFLKGLHQYPVLIVCLLSLSLMAGESYPKQAEGVSFIRKERMLHLEVLSQWQVLYMYKDSSII